ncbi:class I SAM-dependent methyltransferase [Streptomyces noursei]|uniref:class I SAM-dependent methyltransferase n=1 Tax=Streptomyces noursei TaxID=1971 RepID=UPI00196406F8|nr:methyltransferase domain-containing protein [Streptomyces noursei]QRX95362.1 methyltransferase domain-containing protein [Streptomyces noursei]
MESRISSSARVPSPDRSADRSPDRIPARRFAESGVFLLEAVRDMRTTGAVAPSGKALARTLTAPVRARAPQPLTVLEAGAGTGAVTRAVIAHLPAGSHLDVVEANPRFAARLRHLVTTAPRLADAPARVHVHHTGVEHLDVTRRYDVIVSGLPLTNFAPDQVETIMNRYLELLRPGGTLTYLAYRGTRKARAVLAAPPQARRHRAVDEVMDAYQRRYATDCRTIWTNLPPARVWQLRRPLPALPAPRPARGTRPRRCSGAR